MKDLINALLSILEAWLPEKARAFLPFVKILIDQLPAGDAKRDQAMVMIAQYLEDYSRLIKTHEGNPDANELIEKAVAMAQLELTVRLAKAGLLQTT